MLARALVVFSLVGLALPGCGSPPPVESDGGTDAFVPVDAPECMTAEDCDDGLYCNGNESCEGGRCVAGARQRCDDGVACTLDACSEELRTCVHRVPDVDGDGAGDASCVDGTGTPLGTDCADTDANRFPGNTEVCDPDHHDEDCNPDTHGGVDADGDGFESDLCCNDASCGTDCGDGRRDVHPGAVEVCNEINDDCDASTDEGVQITVYADADRDGDGATTATAMQACATTAGVSLYHTDCDDADPVRSGRFLEVCDGIDNDCDGTRDDNTGDVTWYGDADGDGFGSAASGTRVSCIPPAGFSLLGTDCDDTTNTRSPARPEICNGIDEDCNGLADYRLPTPGDTEDDDADGIADLACGAPFGSDCDDEDPNSAPGTPEICDGRDNDCDSRVDEDASSIAFYLDLDGDGFGSDASGTIVGCVPSAGYVRRGGDCDDATAARHPGGTEGCNAQDDDCDGAIDEGSASASCTVDHARQACVAGTCITVTCDDGYADCSLAKAGCETDIADDMTNCGACRTTCTADQGCVLGVCSALPPAMAARYDARVASSLVLGPGGSVTGWRDLSGLANDMTVFTNPPFATATINGRPAIDFANAGMRSATAYGEPFEATVFFVIQQRVSSPSGNIGHHGNVDTGWSMEQNGSAAGHVHFQSAGDTSTAQDVTLTTGGTYILVGRLGVDPAPHRELLVIDASGVVTRSATTTTSGGGTSPLFLGASSDTDTSNAYIGEVIYYTRALADAERDAVIAYLRSGWGI